MIVKNLTGVPQNVTVSEITDEHRDYTISIRPYATTEITFGLTIRNPEKYVGVLEIGGYYPPEIPQEIKEEPKIELPVEEPTVEVEESKEETPVEEVPQEKEVVKDKSSDAHICDICGAEFASARSLSAHKSRAHAE